MSVLKDPHYWLWTAGFFLGIVYGRYCHSDMPSQSLYWTFGLGFVVALSLSIIFDLRRKQ